MGAFRSDSHAGTDYFGLCRIDIDLKGTGKLDKQIVIKWSTLEDNVRDGNEYFWLTLTNPRFKLWGENTWRSDGGNHDIPATIKTQIVIKDDD